MAARERLAETSDSSCIAGAVDTWHFCDIARSPIEFRFRWGSGRAADITAMTESGLASDIGLLTDAVVKWLRQHLGHDQDVVRLQTGHPHQSDIVVRVQCDDSVGTILLARIQDRLGVLEQSTVKLNVVPVAEVVDDIVAETSETSIESE